MFFLFKKNVYLRNKNYCIMMLAVEEKYAFVAYPDDGTTRVIIEGVDYKNDTQYKTLMENNNDRDSVLVLKPCDDGGADTEDNCLVEGVDCLYLVSSGAIVEKCDKKELFGKAIEDGLYKDVVENAMINGYENDDSGWLRDIVCMIMMQVENEEQLVNLRIPYIMGIDYSLTRDDLDWSHLPESYNVGEQGCEMIISGICKCLDEMGWKFKDSRTYNYFIGKSVNNILES